MPLRNVQKSETSLGCKDTLTRCYQGDEYERSRLHVDFKSFAVKKINYNMLHIRHYLSLFTNR